MAANVPYLKYLQNLRESPNKYSVLKGSPTKGIVNRPPAKADLEVYDDDPLERQRDLIQRIKMDDDTKYGMMEEMNTSRALTTEDGTPISLQQALEEIEADKTEKAGPPSGGLMSPEGEEVTPKVDSVPSGSYEEDAQLGAYSNTIAILQDDTEFMTQLASMTEKYPGLTEREIFLVAAKESSVGTNMGSAGNMFQILGTPAQEAGIDLKKLNKSANMTDHLKALEMYLDRWDYDGSAPLGLLVAAPGYRDAAPDSVVYEKGSKELEKNPGWAGADGNATVASITEFYRGQE
jgi:hypothetical protein